MSEKTAFDSIVMIIAIKRYQNADPSYHPYRHSRRIENLVSVLQSHPDAIVESCGDENTGQRYGRAKCRAGRAVKIGYTAFERQYWAVWPV